MVNQLKSQKKGKEKTLNIETESKNLDQLTQQQNQTDLRGQTTTGSMFNETTKKQISSSSVESPTSIANS